MVALRGFISVATIAALVQVAIGSSFNVGGQNGGWDLSTSLAAWAATQTFTVGDSLSKLHPTSTFCICLFHGFCNGLSSPFFFSLFFLFERNKMYIHSNWLVGLSFSCMSQINTSLCIQRLHSHTPISNSIGCHFIDC